MAEPDYYELIGVERDATLQEIRQKFRAKVLAEHPDKGGDPKKFQMLNKAYNVLTDTEKRHRYDTSGRAERTAEEEFVQGFAGGRLHFEPRSREADDKAVVNMQERMGAAGSHEDGFAEWLRQRDQSEMVLTDKDFMKTALFNAAEMATKVNHQGQVQHVLGSPKTDAYGHAVGGAVQVQVKPRPVKKTIDHDELLVRMLAVPVEDNMIYAELNKTGVCLGMSGVGRVEQIGARIEDLREDDCVLVLPKPTKYTSQRPIGTARTLLICNEDDLIKLPSEILEELTPEQICLTPFVVCAYILLEQYGAKLKPGDSVLLNAAQSSAVGYSLLQLCRLLRLKPICLLSIPGAPRNVVKGEYGSKQAFQDSDSRAVAPPAVKQQYERVDEWLRNMGADEVFTDAVALLRWKDRNQRMLPKLALDGVGSRDSCEQLIHCLQPGEKDGQLVVHGFTSSAPIEISPPLLAAWGGKIGGFSITRWVHQLTANSKKMMAIMENVTKLVRANKFLLETVMYKVGEDAISDAFARAADASEAQQVVLLFPSLQEELRTASGESRPERPAASSRPAPQPVQEAPKASQQQKEDEERERLRIEWLQMLFTDQSVAAKSPEGPIPITLEAGNKSSPSALVVWLGDDPGAENEFLKDLPVGNFAMVSMAWTQHPAGEGLVELNINSPEVIDGSWYLRDQTSLENSDLDLLHDCELLGRSFVDTIETKLAQYGLDWKHVYIMGFGKGAGIALYTSLLRLFPKQVNSMVIFCPVVPFPVYMTEKMQAVKRSQPTPLRLFTIWGGRDRSTPPNYRQLLSQTLRKAQDVHHTPDSLQDHAHAFDAKAFQVLNSLLSLVLPR